MRKIVDYVYQCMLNASDNPRFQALGKVYLGALEGTQAGAKNAGAQFEVLQRTGDGSAPLGITKARSTTGSSPTTVTAPYLWTLW